MLSQENTLHLNNYDHIVVNKLGLWKGPSIDIDKLEEKTNWVNGYERSQFIFQEPYLNKYGHVVVNNLGLWQYSGIDIDELVNQSTLFEEKTKWVTGYAKPRFRFRDPQTGDLWISSLNRPFIEWPKLAKTKNNVQLWEQENGNIICWIMRTEKKHHAPLLKDTPQQEVLCPPIPLSATQVWLLPQTKWQ